MEIPQPKIYVTEFEVDECLKHVEKLNEIVQIYGPEQPIVIQVESPGGDLVGLFILLDALNSIPNPIYTYTTGMACSAGFNLLVTGNRNGGQRIVGENAHLMIHGVQMGFGGGYSDLKDVEERVRSTKVMNEQFLKPIAKALGLKDTEELEELVRSKTKSHDLNLTAQEAKELGMVDVIGALKLVPPSPEFGLMIFDTDIEGHRRVCQDPECGCKQELVQESEQEVEQVVDNYLTDLAEIAKDRLKKIKKIPNKKKPKKKK